MGAPKASEAAILRAIKAWTAGTGQPVGRMEVTADGRVIIIAPAVDTPPELPQPAGPKRWTKR